jgi:hypothetical protein
MLDSGVVIFVFYLEKEERRYLTQSTQEYSPDLTIKLTDKEYNQYVKKPVKIPHKDEK